jgi:uncharacterized protein
MLSGCLLHFEHLDEILETAPPLGWFEITSEQLLGSAINDYKPRISKRLERLLSHYPVTLHGLELSIGSVDDLDRRYLRNLRELAEIVQPFRMSDHMVWTGAYGYRAHELLPLPYTQETLDHLCDRVSAVQDFLGRPFVLENPPAAFLYEHSEIPEWEFMNLLVKRTGCGILLDVSNLFVSCRNNGRSADEWLHGIDAAAVQQYHLAGYNVDANGFLLDTHAAPVTSEVWALFARAVELVGPRCVNIEWDASTPAFEVLHDHAREAEAITTRIVADAPGAATTDRRHAPSGRRPAEARPARIHQRRSVR